MLKKNYLLFYIIILLSFNVYSCFSLELVDYGREFNLGDGKLVGYGVNIEKNQDFLILDFNSDDSVLFINQRKFENLKNNIGESGKIILSNDRILSFEYANRIFYNGIKDRGLKILKYRIHYSGILSEKAKEKSYSHISDFLNNLSLELKKSVKDIYVLSSEKFDEVSGIPLSVGFAKLDNTGSLYLKENYVSFDVFIHEVSHLYHYKLRESVNYTIIDDEKIYNDSFTKEWINISGKYNKVKVTKEGNYLYKDAVFDFGPRLGYTRPYGGKDEYEDIATSIENINNPEFYKNLLSEENIWNLKYRQKLDLLYQYKFITESEYKRVLSLAGVK